jgi:low affinity Fe/Cu permease
MKLSALFKRFASAASRATGKPITFVLAALIVVVWGVSGPLFGFSDTWQLVINTGTTIITFLMVFLIQNTQNRDSEAMHIKMDEMIRAIQGAHNALLDLEELEDDDLDRIRKRYRKLAEKARNDIEAGGVDIGCGDVDADGDDGEDSKEKSKAASKPAATRKT